MTRQQLHQLDIIEYAEELGERFPDMSDSEILLSCSEFAHRNITESHLLGIAVLQAYNGNYTGAISLIS